MDKRGRWVYEGNGWLDGRKKSLSTFTGARREVEREGWFEPTEDEGLVGA